MLDTDTLLTLLHATRHSKRRDFYRLLIAALSYRDFGRKPFSLCTSDLEPNPLLDLGQAATLVRIGARARMNVISANCFRRAFEQVSRHSKVLDPETHFGKFQTKTAFTVKQNFLRARTSGLCVKMCTHITREDSRRAQQMLHQRFQVIAVGSVPILLSRFSI